MNAPTHAIEMIQFPTTTPEPPTISTKRIAIVIKWLSDFDRSGRYGIRSSFVLFILISVRISNAQCLVSLAAGCQHGIDITPYLPNLFLIGEPSNRVPLLPLAEASFQELEQVLYSVVGFFCVQGLTAMRI